ncbi:TlpA family protein disulfide reductase [Fusobacterium hwasookii]|uniref:Thiol:disulfide interchange protein n=5 Tax=Fusobacterium TaxID=848 RepID=A0A0S2ZKF1_9FUSO|nr:TlpA disulfide reductase family protein [Fusobacterium hwasookii]ALQ34710.1 thiol:disulfide interchange protein [Fusobacterium hwasookii ChDC F206]ALQ38594.1 thiol:disulfide interchange protein [Fusobacterium hwasookii ChDC F300]ALQ39320.1 thiol:disulfide interchange protein [Fusobacterium hwasookii ChDC F174]EJU07617.1 thiol:disulfide interchange protein TlpA [Fusobacterium hwasookii ChDC F128]QNE66289.1 TlpA family protein disulfide reductase [Fusobacterium hwasookii]
MRFKSKLLLVLVFIVMSFSAFAAKSNKKEDVKMPNIVLYDQYGKKHSLEEYKGKVVVINFWATWCGYCVRELPEFEKVYKEFGSNKKDVVILGVAGPKTKENPNNVDVEKDKIISFLKKKNVTYPTLMDEAGKSFDDYGIKYFPTTYVINKNGYLEGFVNGAISGEQLKNAINETLKKK